MQGLIDFLSSVLGWLLALTKATIQTLFTMLEDLIAWVLHVLFSVVIELINSFGDCCVGGLNFPQLSSAFPAEILNVFWLLGIPHCLACIGVAYLIRFCLQLIPFTRLGS
jgi:hypothetical protein